MTIQPEPLTPAAYRDYGEVIAARADLPHASANMGTARRFDRAAVLENLRPGRAQPNLCVFRCRPASKRPFKVRLLERHALSTQAFIPMGGAGRYLAIVCRGAHRPDLGTLRAFFAKGSEGITYRPGVWHHPMVALDRTRDFACLVWEDGTKKDCEETRLKERVTVKWST